MTMKGVKQLLERERGILEYQIARVRRVMDILSPPPKRKRKLSAAARKRISDAQTERWRVFHKKQARKAPLEFRKAA